MSLRRLRPVGEPLGPAGGGPAGWPAGYRVFLVQSGTAALALALVALAARAPGRRRVLLPGYGCPDLVAAVVHAGLTPELVDTLPGQPFMDPARLASQLGDDVLAVLGVHVLGLAERLAELSSLAAARGAVLVEDSAQRLPEADGPLADLVVLSFGRGKPAGALGGGALLLREPALAGLEVNRFIGPASAPRLPAALSRRLYNLLISPWPYGLVSRLPGLGLGATVYRPLAGIHALDPARAAFAASQFRRSRARLPGPAQSALREGLGRLPAVVDLAAEQPGARLLRYPLLAPDRATRDCWYARLSAAGLGASVFYGQALADLPGLPPCREAGLDQSRQLAGRLLTLPVHSAVRPADLRRMLAILASG